MTFIAGILTFLIIVNCLLLILLVLVQLPKKDAGAGMAFGAGTADALFGAGSGNVLTKITKFAVMTLLVLALFISYLQDKAAPGAGTVNFEKAVEQQQRQKQMGPPPTQPANPPAPASTAPPVTSVPATAPAPSTPAPK